MRELFILWFLLIGTATASTEEVNYVNLGATLLKDGYTQRAKTVLDKADVTKENFDFARYYSLKGILFNKLSYPTLSNIFFKASIKHGQDNPSIHLYMAKNNWQLREYAQVVSELKQAGQAAKDSESLMVIWAEAYKQQGEMEKAWAKLDEGIGLYPQSNRFYRQKFYYLIELGYFQTALDYANKYLEAKQFSAKDYLAVAYALRENKQYYFAASLLEDGLIKHPGDEKIVELLGQVYIDNQHYLAAALVYDWASIENPQFAQKAAALFLKAKLPARSLQLNRRIIDQKEKFRQRLGIDIHLDDYESLVAKVPALKRYDLMTEDNIAYAVGYGYFQNGDFSNAKKYLKQVRDGQLFAKASRLFLKIEKCQDAPLECY